MSQHDVTEQEPAGTKLALILAAGELFAKHGLDGASVRSIAEKAGANIAAINYHFGSKENLYTEVLRYAILQGKVLRPAQFVDDPRLNTPEGGALVIRDIVDAWFADYFEPHQPAWFGRVLILSLIDPTSSLQTIVKQIFEPDHAAMRKIIHRIRPDLSEDETQFLTLSLSSQVAFYEFCRVPILIMLGKDRYDAEFLAKAAEHVTRMMLSALSLPFPEV